MDRRLRVLQVSARFLPQVGGVERHVFEVASRLAGHGIESEVLTTDATDVLAHHEVLDGISVERVRAWPRERDLHFAPELFNRISNGRWDVVHVQGIHTLVPPLAMSAARRAGIPYVVTFHSGGHSSQVRSRLRPLQWLAMSPLLRRASALIAVSAFERESFARQLRISRRRFVVIPNGAEITESVGAIAERPVDHNLVVSVGRLERYKGHRRVLEALPHLISARPDARLRIIGSGPDGTYLTRRAEELGLADRVEIGPIRTEDRMGLFEMLATAGVVTLLSEYEAHPVAIMEALSLGRPVLVATTSGLTELVDQGWARGVPLDVPAPVVAHALHELLDQPQQAPRRLPSWNDTAASLAAVYRHVARSVDGPHRVVDGRQHVADPDRPSSIDGAVL